VLCLSGLLPGHAGAAFYWGFGTLSNDPSVCFVGDALADRPDRVAQILDYMSEFERVANIDFDYLGTCPAPTVGPTGLDWHDGDIRIYIPNVGIGWNIPVPGNGCTIGFVNSSFGREPAYLTLDRPCLYDLELGDDADSLGVPWRNHTLHEVGHSLGLAHEHQRPDAPDPTTCIPMASSCPVPSNPANEAVRMTDYDPDSVMNYVIAACGIDGNYSHSGLSQLDRLALHILYPEDARVAEVVGTRVVRTPCERRARSDRGRVRAHRRGTGGRPDRARARACDAAAGRRGAAGRRTGSAPAERGRRGRAALDRSELIRGRVAIQRRSRAIHGRRRARSTEGVARGARREPSGPSSLRAPATTGQGRKLRPGARSRNRATAARC
jgi:hypothetical protein